MTEHIHQAILESDMDSTTTITIYDREKTSALKLVRKILGLTWANSVRNPANEHASRYRDSGLWGYYREKGVLHFLVAVGCACEHDCCGHQSRLSYSISKLNYMYFAVVTERTYNF